MGDVGGIGGHDGDGGGSAGSGDGGEGDGGEGSGGGGDGEGAEGGGRGGCGGATSQVELPVLLPWHTPGVTPSVMRHASPSSRALIIEPSPVSVHVTPDEHVPLKSQPIWQPLDVLHTTPPYEEHGL